MLVSSSQARKKTEINDSCTSIRYPPKGHQQLLLRLTALPDGSEYRSFASRTELILEIGLHIHSFIF